MWAGSSKKRTTIVCCCLLLLMMIFSLFIVSLLFAILSPPFGGMRCGSTQRVIPGSFYSSCVTLFCTLILMLIPFFVSNWIWTHFYLRVLYENFYGLHIFLIATYPPPKRAILLRCSIIIVFPHTNCATSTACFSGLFSSVLSRPPSLHLPLLHVPVYFFLYKCNYDY